ncbi:S8 family serine peptidase [Tsuneonella mangrovi]|uniref:S8 family serine peptidase n=1 Tax=Tsuneonella mangrovi TaxID=1982042 RepID=UPI000BA20547|nr:S8 family serine peptidase [Tsuneonella mangrovi]
MRLFATVILAGALSLAAPASAQVVLPGVPLPNVGDTVGQVTGQVEGVVGEADLVTGRIARKLERARLSRITDLVRAHPDAIALDASGNPARKGVLLAMGADSASLAAAAGAGFAVIGHEQIAGLDLEVTRLSVPGGMELADAERALKQLLPDASVSADVLYAQAGRSIAGNGKGAPNSPTIDTPVGMIDGAPGAAIKVAAVRGFASGGGTPSDHGSEVAGLLAGQGVATIRVADVYGTDPAGGSALAIARGLGWLVQTGSKVISISLVGPRNPVFERAIGAVQRNGVAVVAAVGNDGPAAPPAYPASYPGVVAVSAVDRHDRGLIEAGRALHLDYVAPGAGIRAPDARGLWGKVRGTSFATPLVAARIAAALGATAKWRPILDREALDLGPRGPDKTYGRGLVCGNCAR